MIGVKKNININPLRINVRDFNPNVPTERVYLMKSNIRRNILFYMTC